MAKRAEANAQESSEGFAKTDQRFSGLGLRALVLPVVSSGLSFIDPSQGRLQEGGPNLLVLAASVGAAQGK